MAQCKVEDISNHVMSSGQGLWRGRAEGGGVEAARDSGSTHW